MMKAVFEKDRVAQAQLIFGYRGGHSAYQGLRILFSEGETAQLRNILDHVVYGDTVTFADNRIFVNDEIFDVDTEVAIEAARLFGHVNRNTFGTY